MVRRWRNFRADIVLVMIGDGPARERAERTGDRTGRVGTHHVGGCSSGRGQCMAAFDVFALSSRTEGTPMVLLEAMAARVPIVAHQWAACRTSSLGHRGGSVVRDRRSRSLADIDGVLRDPRDGGPRRAPRRPGGGRGDTRLAHGSTATRSSMRAPRAADYTLFDKGSSQADNSSGRDAPFRIAKDPPVRARRPVRLHQQPARAAPDSVQRCQLA